MSNAMSSTPMIDGFEATSLIASGVVRAFLDKGKLLGDIVSYPREDPMGLGINTATISSAAALASLMDGGICSARTREHRFYRQQGPSQQVLEVCLLGIQRFSQDQIEWTAKLLRVKTSKHPRLQGFVSLYFAVAARGASNYCFEPHFKDKEGMLQTLRGTYKEDGLVNYLLSNLDLLWFQAEIREE